jgi:2-dehydro-3-deoxygluconokinase
VGGGPDVLVLGEVLIELSSPVPLIEARDVTLSVSGDAMNAAAAAAAAGAHTALVTAVADDALGDRIVRFAEEHGVDTTWVQRRPEPNGIYFAAADRGGARAFVYARRGSAASHVGPEDVLRAPLAGAGAVLAGGIAHAVSASSAAAVLAAAEAASGRLVYDPNFRERLATPDEARAALHAVAPHAALLVPAWPADTVALLGTDDPEEAARACVALGAAAAAVTCGGDGVVAATEAGVERFPAPPAGEIVDTTGAGDVFAGTAAARLALGDPLREAIRLGVAAATLSLAGAGGTGALPTLEQTRALAVTG